MADAPRETWITGIGIVSCLGEGPGVHWQRLNEPPPSPDTTAFAPYIVHRLAPIEFDKQIPRKGDQRQMEGWQRIGTYAAGLALDSAGVKGNPELLARMDMIVAAAGGERDEAVDTAILSGLPDAPSRGRFMNERLMSDLRPTLFLAQLSNLLAGNISIVHGVAGSSRTFMGEDAAGVEAVRVALARIESGQSEIALVGGAYNGERKDLLLVHEFGGHALKAPFAPVWERQTRGGGLALGALGAFLVLEARSHAMGREAKPLARISRVVSDRCRRQEGETKASLARLWDRLGEVTVGSRIGIISGATGAEPATSEERAWLNTLSGAPVRATGTYLGHGFEPQFPMNIAVAALAVSHRRLFPPADSSGVEQPAGGILDQVVVTSVGHWRGEGMALVEQAR
ncbi:MAG TPA: beta-ketoacyl-ACP synthase [Xanthobacteraceae bacterium]|jgi:3-oxoacyl-[acyl-carrier-protein] synthase II